MTTVTIRPPSALSFEQQRLAVGDTFQFLDKMNATQSKLETFATEILTFVADIESAINVIDQIATNSAEDAANGVVTNLTQIRDQILQATSDAEGTLSQIQQSFNSAMSQISDEQTAVLESINLLSDSRHQSIELLSADRIETMEDLAAFAKDEADRASGLAASFTLPTEVALPGGVIVQNDEGSGFVYQLFHFDSLPGKPINKLVDQSATLPPSLDRYYLLSGITITLPAAQSGERITLAKQADSVVELAAASIEFQSNTYQTITWDIGTELDLIYDNNAWRLL